MGSRDAVDQALHRLAEQNVIQRLDRGIYYYAVSSVPTNSSTPAHRDAIARALAAQTGDRALLTGEEAAARMGLLPHAISVDPAGYYEYLTTGRSKERRVGAITIRFRHTSFSPPESISEASVQVMQALQYLKRENITPEVMRACIRHLQPGEREQLRKLAAQSPAWLIPILHHISVLDIKEPISRNTSAQSRKIIEPA